MDLLLIIGLILWISSSVKKRKEEQKRREAARARTRAAAFAEAAEQQPAPAPQPVQPTADASRPRPWLTTPQQRRHPLSPSRKTGHAHMETSMTGINDVCPPAPAPAAPVQESPFPNRADRIPEKHRTEAAVPAAVAAARGTEAAEPAFRYDPARVREGLIYAEILGKPKALRR